MYPNLYIVDLSSDEVIPDTDENITIVVVDENEEKKFVVNKIVYCSSNCIQKSINNIIQKLSDEESIDNYINVSTEFSAENSSDIVLIRENETEYKNAIVTKICSIKNGADQIAIKHVAYCKHIGKKLDTVKKILRAKASVETEIKRLLHNHLNIPVTSHIDYLKDQMGDKIRKLVSINVKCSNLLSKHKKEVAILQNFIKNELNNSFINEHDDNILKI